MSNPRRIAILGVSGSIGRQALEVINESAGELQLVAASVHSKTEILDALILKHPDLVTAVTGGDGGTVSSVEELIEASQPDVVLNSIVGFAGLRTTLSALERGIDIALANKESLVAGGTLCMDAAQKSGARILPVDSEHSAMLQCLGSTAARNDVASLVLTASGGPFFGMQTEELKSVTVEQALNHPTWSMGGKITIDSATLMNKGLELIEAQVLFDVTPDEIEVVVHRHSIVHALVRHVDGSLLAHLGWPDMKVPIAWALNWPQRRPVETKHLDLTDMPALEFHKPDEDTFHCLALARDAARHGGSAPLVLNAGNEIAVDRFLAGELGFLEIAEHVEHVLESVEHSARIESFEHAEELDSQARHVAVKQTAALSRQ